MNEQLKTLIQEGFADCTTTPEVAVFYAELRMEIEKQMEVRMEMFDVEEND